MKEAAKAKKDKLKGKDISAQKKKISAWVD